MSNLNDAIKYFLSFETFVLLPIIIFILALVFGIKIKVAIKSALQLGIGFVGMFMTFDYFVNIIQPVVSQIILRSGLEMGVLDLGWPPLAAITWSFNLAPVLLVSLIVVNALMLIFKLTRTVNIDIWNYWHIIFLGSMVYHITNNTWATITVAIISFVLLLKLSEWIGPKVGNAMGMEGICTPHLAGIIHYPLAIVGNSIIDRIPRLNKVEADPETIQEKLGVLGEPMIIGFVLGALLGLSAGYEFKEILSVAVRFSAVIFILPKMSGILGESLIPISHGMKSFMEKKLPNVGQTYIGLDVAILFGLPANIVTALLLIPTSIILSILLPGVNFIPLGDLTSLLVPVAFITLATKGNVIRSYLISIPIIIVTLYTASWVAPLLTGMAKAVDYNIVGTQGQFTSFLDGGNPFRVWVAMLFSGKLIAFIFIPIVIWLLYLTWKSQDKIK